MKTIHPASRIVVSVARARQDFSTILGRVAFGHSECVVTRRGKPFVRIVPCDAGGAEPHLADAAGWLDADDSFLKEMGRIQKKRSRERPRPIL